MDHCSRPIARRFVDWLGVSPGSDWFELGAGAGGLTSAILSNGSPASLLATDLFEGFVAPVRRSTDDPRVTAERADAGTRSQPGNSRDAVVSGPRLNFLADRRAALEEMMRLTRPRGLVAFYVWDYPGGGVGFLHAFWQAVIDGDPRAAALAEAKRFDFCTPDRLASLLYIVGATGVRSVAFEDRATFDSFDDLWEPFTLGPGPAPGYCASLDGTARAALRARFEARLAADESGRITTPLRAWGVSGRVPSG